MCDLGACPPLRRCCRASCNSQHPDDSSRCRYVSFWLWRCPFSLSIPFAYEPSARANSRLLHPPPHSHRLPSPAHVCRLGVVFGRATLSVSLLTPPLLCACSRLFRKSFGVMLPPRVALLLLGVCYCEALRQACSLSPCAHQAFFLMCTFFLVVVCPLCTTGDPGVGGGECGPTGVMQLFSLRNFAFFWSTHICLSSPLPFVRPVKAPCPRPEQLSLTTSVSVSLFRTRATEIWCTW